MVAEDTLKHALAYLQYFQEQIFPGTGCFCSRHDDRKRKTCASYLKKRWSQIKIRQLFPASIPHFAYLSFTCAFLTFKSLYEFVIWSHLIPITCLSLYHSHSLFIVFPCYTSFFCSPCVSIIISLPILSSLTIPSMYLCSLPDFTCVLVNHSTTHFLSV